MLIKAMELVWDTTVYPRTDVSTIHISTIADALRTGEKLPPIIIDKKTKRIADGVHRWKANLKAFGDKCEVECEVISYKDDKELLLDAIRRNTAHGLGLDQHEKTRCILTLEQMGVSKEEITSVLRMTPQTYQRYEAKTAFRVIDSVRPVRSSSPSEPERPAARERIPLKTPMKSLQGKVLNKKQESLNRYIGGMRPLYYVNCVIGLLESDVYESESEDFMKAIEKLRDLLNKKLRKKAS